MSALVRQLLTGSVTGEAFLHGIPYHFQQIGPTEPPRVRRYASGVSFLMRPLSVRVP
jgi:hypothetical protein